VLQRFRTVCGKFRQHPLRYPQGLWITLSTTLWAVTAIQALMRQSSGLIKSSPSPCAGLLKKILLLKHAQRRRLFTGAVERCSDKPVDESLQALRHNAFARFDETFASGRHDIHRACG
jgi:hypothetical protein